MKARKGPMCAVGALKATLNAADEAELDDLIADPAFDATQVMTAVKVEWKIDLPAGSVRRHRHALQGRPDGCRCLA
jgi:hypothetical protein